MKKIFLLSLLLLFSLLGCEQFIGHSHKYSGNYLADDTYHWQECECGNSNSKAMHDWQASEIVKEATVNEEGLEKTECKVCGYTIEKILPKLEHTHEYASEYQYDSENHWQESLCGHDDLVVSHEFIIEETMTETLGRCICGYSYSLSKDYSLNLSKIGELEVTGSKITLTTAEYTKIKTNPLENLTYQIHEKANINASVVDNMLKILVTAENGDYKEYEYELAVLSNKASLVISKILGYEINNQMIVVSQQDYNLLKEANILQLTAMNYSKGAQVSATFDEALRKITYLCTSEDQTNTTKIEVSVAVKEMFTQSLYTGYGNGSNCLFNYEQDGYLLTGNVIATDYNSDNLVNNYYYKCDVELIDFNTSSELVFAAFGEDNLVIRYVIRGTSNDEYLVFSDYKDTSSFVNYTEHVGKTVYSKGEKLTVEIIALGQSVIMRFEGQTVYRRTLNTLLRHELAISKYLSNSLISNIEVNTEIDFVNSKYREALEGYTDKNFGITLLNNSQNIDSLVQNSDGNLFVDGDATNQRVMAAYYEEGVPVGGYEWALKGKVDLANTKTTGPAASKVEFQVCMDVRNFVKFHLFRYPTNNSFYIYSTDNGVETTLCAEKNTMPKGTEYSCEYIVIYRNGLIEFWLKDNVYLKEYKCMYSVQKNWKYASYAFAMRQYVDVTLKDTEALYNEAFDEIYSSLHSEEKVQLSVGKEAYQKPAFVTESFGNSYYVDYSGAQPIYLHENNTLVSGNYLLVSGNMLMRKYSDWSQSAIIINTSDGKAVRYVFEYASNGYFQVFTERKDANSSWYGWKAVYTPTSSSRAGLNFAVINNGGKVSFLIQNEVWHSYDDLMLENAYITFSGGKCMSKLSSLRLVKDENSVKEFAANMKEYQYVSSYESRITKLYNEYKDVEKGGIVLAGSSTIDFWDTWQEDLGEDVLAYNVGIGGTTTFDWIYAYERLIKSLNPSKLVLFVGGNDINVFGETGLDTAERVKQILETVHKDLPNCEIIYVLSLPVPSCYAKGQWTKVEFKYLTDEMKNYGKANSSWLTIVDLEKDLTDDFGDPVPEYNRTDGIHLTAEGYKVWTAKIKPVLGL